MKSNNIQDAVRTTRVLFRLMLHQPEQYLHIHGMLYYKVSREFLKRIGLSKDEYNTLNLAIILHDIGKLGVPGKILWSHSALSNPEYEAVKRHAEMGRDVVRLLGYNEWVARVVGQHHERLDGTGYPDGLTENEIDRLAKIIAILDTYDVMRRGRVYKPAMTKQQIIETFNEIAGKKLDKDLCNLLVQCIQEE